ncbi:MAG TPA: succinate dehydrogenase, partial [Pseudothermotoga sp.]|nr:succinate dehydrogenase [Pseudothermotoga sp.]
RPGGNSLLDTQVFGAIAGRNAAIEARQMTFVPVETNQDIFNSGEIPSSNARRLIIETMSKSAFLVRKEGEIARALDTIQSLENQGICLDERGLSHLLETKNMLLLAKVILTAILLRDESRGPHLRFSHFEPPVMNFLPRKDEWNKYIVFWLDTDQKLRYEVRFPVRPRGD